MLDQALFGEAPKAFNPVNINLAGGKALFMIHFKMPVAAKHQRIIDAVPVSIDNGTPSNGLHREVQDGFRLDIFQGLHLDQAVPF